MPCRRRGLAVQIIPRLGVLGGVRPIRLRPVRRRGSQADRAAGWWLSHIWLRRRTVSRRRMARSTTVSNRCAAAAGKFSRCARSSSAFPKIPVKGLLISCRRISAKSAGSSAQGGPEMHARTRASGAGAQRVPPRGERNGRRGRRTRYLHPRLTGLHLSTSLGLQQTPPAPQRSAHKGLPPSQSHRELIHREQ